MTDLVQIIQEYGIEQLGRYYGTYRAIVMENEDNTHTNQLLVNIAFINQGITTWAKPKGMEGSIGSGFKWLTPKPGQIVYVEFENGNPLKPIWSYHGWAIDEKPDELDNDTIGIITPKGNQILIKEEDGNLVIDMNGYIVFNQGNNGGLVKVEALRSCIEAIAKDLTQAGAGTNLSEWMAKGLSELENTKIQH